MSRLFERARLSLAMGMLFAVIMGVLGYHEDHIQWFAAIVGCVIGASIYK